MTMTMRNLLFVAGVLLPQACLGWTSSSSSSASSPESTSWSASRRDALRSVIGSSAALLLPNLAVADDEDPYRFERRDRNGNKEAVIREDYWYSSGVTPPRRLASSLKMDDPKWNAFGSCETTGSGSAATNSCTYISLKQRQPAYSKYAFSITQGAKEFQQLKPLLQQKDWNRAASYVFVNANTNLPPAPVDAQLKMVLFASLMLTSPNYSGPAKELLVARFYVNEFKYAVTEIASAIQEQDAPRALAAWEFGKDSFNSYSQVVNRQITAKVGDPLPFIE
ncbi:expressed unknown protein [Seminavis robusta]|uniref:Uncharacterized protein n=1 Tax=Seminavis robusta TaxID=568900 RepID=A0A9N8D9E8_9STRA|nr:expressed unknown protein [Seminavis robusta]|eukprot:Sro40_g024780.1 n/a (280) ;mRNA; r:99198-100037